MFDPEKKLTEYDYEDHLPDYEIDALPVCVGLICYQQPPARTANTLEWTMMANINFNFSCCLTAAFGDTDLIKNLSSFTALHK